MGIEEVRAKLKWTHHHFKQFDSAVMMYVDPENIWISPKRYNDTNTEVWGFFESRNPEWTIEIISHMFGDVLQTANSCLDYLVCELFRRYNPGKEAMSCHQFPLVSSHGAFNEEIGRNRLFGIPFEAIAVIEGLQPYDGRTDPVPSDLLTLRNLTNTHKHRKIHVAVLTANPAPSDPSLIIEEDGEFFVRTGDLPRSMHFKAEVGPFPINPDGQVDVKGQYGAMIVLEEGRFSGDPITVVAARFCNAVNEACRRLDSFFE